MRDLACQAFCGILLTSFHRFGEMEAQKNKVAHLRSEQLPDLFPPSFFFPRDYGASVYEELWIPLNNFQLCFIPFRPLSLLLLLCFLLGPL